MDNKNLWQSALEELQLNISSGNYLTWFKGKTVIIDQKETVIEIGCNTTYTKDWLETRYYAQIKLVLDRLTGQNNSLIFAVALKEYFPPKPQATTSVNDFQVSLFEAKPKPPPSLALREEFTFENFAVSTSNQLAHAAALAVAQNPGRSYNPLFIYGGVGVGKTHLMQAIGHDILRKDPKKKIIYCMGEDFTNEIIEAIRRKATKEFKEKYRKTDALLIDDIQFIAGKVTVQEEFFHTFNTLQRSGAQIVLVSDEPPPRIQNLEDRLRSRFEGGMVVDVAPPDFELRSAILLIKANSLGVDLPIDVAKLIAHNIESTRKLEGFLIRLVAEIRLRKIGLGEELAREILTKVNGPLNGESKRSLIPKEVVDKVAEHFNLKPLQLKSAHRTKSLSTARQIAMYLLRTELGLPLMEVGRLLGGRDHTTIMYGVEKITNLLSTNSGLMRELVLIKESLYGK